MFFVKHSYNIKLDYIFVTFFNNLDSFLLLKLKIRFKDLILIILMSETFAFSADINQLLSLIINTFYTNKDVFLRELVCNASDALDKLRYTSLTNQELNKEELCIQLKSDKSNKTLTISDNGIGMSKEELVNNLGTIAKSGTKAFMESLQAGSDMSMIGQFGVGFYSAFLVADKVEVSSKQDNDAFKWSSTAGGSFTIEKDEEMTERGTKIVLYMKDDMLNYLEESTIRSLVQKHSEYITFPIQLYVERTKEVDKPDSDSEDDIDADKTVIPIQEDDKSEVKEETEVKEEDKSEVTEETEEVKAEKIIELSYEWEQLNKQQPIWLRKPKEVTQEDYNSFYKSLTNDWQEPMTQKHFSVEGQLEFKSILFVPKRSDMDMIQQEKKKNFIKLYVRRVFIMDNCEELLPEWLNFVKGVVDSEDLPLNISRETLQQNKILKVIRKNLIKKSIDMMSEVEDYKTFYEQYSKNIKLGIHEESNHKEKLAELLRFQTTKGEFVSLEEYISRMKENQKNIYYITGESINSIQNSPCLEQLKEKDYEVLFMCDAIDEYMMQQLKEFSSKTFVSITKDKLEFEQSNEEKEQYENQTKTYKPLCDFIKKTLDSDIQSVSVSSRLKTSPCILVTSEYGLTANMERIMKAQALQSVNPYMKTSKVFEINPNSDIIQNLKQKYENDANDKTVKDLIWLLYETTLINSGFTMENPNSYTNRIHKLIRLGLDINNSEDTNELNETLDEDLNEELNETIEETMEQVD